MSRGPVPSPLSAPDAVGSALSDLERELAAARALRDGMSAAALRDYEWLVRRVKRIRRQLSS